MTATRLPQAVIIGAPKAGTTTLCAALARHPGVFMCPGKETHFFNHHYETRGLAWYQSHFSDAQPDQIVMEGTPDYAMSNHVAPTMERMAGHMPQARLIFMVRDPIERIESHYVQMLSNNRKVVPMSQALEQWPEIVGTSDYDKVLEQVYLHYAREQVLVLFLDDYARNKRAVHARVLDFIGARGFKADLDLMEAQDPTHTRDKQGMDGAVLARLRRLKQFSKLHAMVPAPVIKLGKQLLRRPIKVSSTLELPLRQQLSRDLGPAWQAFQARYRQPSPD